jgi:hypothetical protein
VVEFANLRTVYRIDVLHRLDHFCGDICYVFRPLPYCHVSSTGFVWELNSILRRMSNFKKLLFPFCRRELGFDYSSAALQIHPCIIVSPYNGQRTCKKLSASHTIALWDTEFSTGVSRFRQFNHEKQRSPRMRQYKHSTMFLIFAIVHSVVRRYGNAILITSLLQ